jgi:hypothetical protein
MKNENMEIGKIIPVKLRRVYHVRDGTRMKLKHVDMIVKR